MKYWIRFFFINIFIMVLFCGCVTKIDVTHDVLDTVGPKLFSNFKFHLSKDITLRENVKIGEHLEQTGPGAITVSNAELYLGHLTAGRFLKEIPPDRLEIYFEELPNGRRPALTFLLEKNDKKEERYYVETVWGKGYVVDTAGTLGYKEFEGDIVSYNGKEYFIDYIGNEKNAVKNKPSERPYLIQELDVNVIQEKHEIKGAK